MQRDKMDKGTCPAIIFLSTQVQRQHAFPPPIVDYSVDCRGGNIQHGMTLISYSNSTLERCCREVCDKHHTTMDNHDNHRQSLSPHKLLTIYDLLWVLLIVDSVEHTTYGIRHTVWFTAHFRHKLAISSGNQSDIYPPPKDTTILGYC